MDNYRRDLENDGRHSWRGIDGRFVTRAAVLASQARRLAWLAAQVPTPVEVGSWPARMASAAYSDAEADRRAFYGAASTPVARPERAARVRAARTAEILFGKR